MTITASCGHVLAPNEAGQTVRQMMRHADGGSGISYALFCERCARQAAPTLAPTDAIEAIWLHSGEDPSVESLVNGPHAMTPQERLLLVHRLGDYDTPPMSGRHAPPQPHLRDEDLVERLQRLAPLDFAPTTALSTLIPWLMTRLGGRLRQLTTRPDATGRLVNITASCFWVTETECETWTIEDETIERALARAVLLFEAPATDLAGKRWR